MITIECYKCPFKTSDFEEFKKHIEQCWLKYTFTCYNCDHRVKIEDIDAHVKKCWMY
jgi:hypothetical protein